MAYLITIYYTFYSDIPTKWEGLSESFAIAIPTEWKKLSESHPNEIDVIIKTL